MQRLLSATRYLILIGVLASLLLATALLVVSLGRTLFVIGEAVPRLASDSASKQLMVASIQIADLILIATVLAIVGVGLYELFIGDVALPEWMIIKTLDDLKSKLLGVIVVVLAVSFVATASNWSGGPEILAYGAAIALVILALTAYGLVGQGAKGPPK